MTKGDNSKKWRPPVYGAALQFSPSNHILALTLVKRKGREWSGVHPFFWLGYRPHHWSWTLRSARASRYAGPREGPLSGRVRI